MSAPSSTFASGLNLYNGALELSSTINTVLPTLRRTAPPAFVAYSRHWRQTASDAPPPAAAVAVADSTTAAIATPTTNAAPVDVTLKEFINTSITKHSSASPSHRRASVASVDGASVASVDDSSEARSAGVKSNQSQGSDVDLADNRQKPLASRRPFDALSPTAVLVLPRSSSTLANVDTSPSASYMVHSPSMLSIHSVSSLSVPASGSDFDFGREFWHLNLEDRELNSRASTTITDDVAVAGVADDSPSHQSGEEAGSEPAAFVSAVVQPVPDVRRPFVQRPSHYLGELVWQVDDVVFCGGIEAAHNENLLCRLNIAIIIDISGQYDDPDLKNRPRNECPCLCSRRTAHSRTTMYVNVRDRSVDAMRDSSTSVFPHSHSPDSKKMEKEREIIIDSFRQIVQLTQEARIKQQRVLIHSLKCRNRAPAFVAAYLMKCTPCTRVQALMRISNLMSKTRPGMCISDGLQRALMRWQTILGIRPTASNRQQNDV